MSEPYEDETSSICLVLGLCTLPEGHAGKHYHRDPVVQMGGERVCIVCRVRGHAAHDLDAHERAAVERKAFPR